MPIVLENDNEAVDAAKAGALDYLSEPISAAWVPTKPRLSPGFAVHRILFDEIQRGIGPRNVAGWRYFLLEDDEGVSAAIHVDTSSKEPEVTHVTHDARVAAAVDAIAWIEDVLGERTGIVSFLDAPSVFVEAIRVDEDTSWFVPFESLSDTEVFERHARFSLDEFSELLGRRAEAREAAQSE